MMESLFYLAGLVAVIATIAAALPHVISNPSVSLLVIKPFS